MPHLQGPIDFRGPVWCFWTHCFYSVSWRTTRGRLSMTAYSIYSLLTSISGGILTHPQPEGSAMPWRVSRQTLRLEDHSCSAVHDCLFNILAADLHIWRHTHPSATRSFVNSLVMFYLLTLFTFIKLNELVINHQK